MNSRSQIECKTLCVRIRVDRLERNARRKTINVSLSQFYLNWEISRKVQLGQGYLIGICRIYGCPPERQAENRVDFKKTNLSHSLYILIFNVAQ